MQAQTGNEVRNTAILLSVDYILPEFQCEKNLINNMFRVPCVGDSPSTPKSFFVFRRMLNELISH